MTSIFPKEDLQKIHVSETSAIECFNLLQKLCKHDHEFVTENSAKTKMYYVKNTSGHKFKIRHKIFSAMIFTQVNPPNWYQISKDSMKSLTLMTLM